MSFNCTEPIVVTVVTVTYNHENYLEKCLGSLISQITDFRYQILVGDDCSTDRTTEIVREFAKKYPDKIVPIIREKNVGSMRNFGELCMRAMKESEFIAFCDGDDYWIDDYKLQKQVDYLRENPKLAGCFCNAKMLIPEGHSLLGYYTQAKDGNYYYPTSVPEFRKTSDGLYNVINLISSTVPMPVEVMLRSNKEIDELPDWFWKNKYLGDVPIFLLNMGDKSMGFMENECMSVYRRNFQSLTSYDTIDDNFLNTRPDWILALTGLREFYLENYKGFGVVQIENRIKRETANYLRVLVKYDMKEEIAEFFATFPEAGKISLNAFISFYFDSQRMTARYSWEGNKVVARDPFFMRVLTPFVKLYLKIKKSKILHKIKDGIKEFFKFVLYWVYSIIPKKKTKWAFSSFRSDKYMDNAKYYFEYVSNNHPEIEAIWFTKNEAVYEKLVKEGYHCEKMRSLSGIWNMARCKVAVLDHFRMTDFNPLYGLNHRTKIVQLWHGAGLKCMGDGQQVKNTTVKGVQYSYDILPTPEDAWFVRVKKRFKYIFCAHARELFEEYFLFMCPGQERVDTIGRLWNIPEENYLRAGHPRNDAVYMNLDKEVQNNVIYVPTYRINADDEKEMVLQCLDSLDYIQEVMEKYDGNFVLRLHPHTWRSYVGEIKKRIKNYSRIKIDNTEDIYSQFHNYKVVISDYSSLAYDFLLFDKPVVFFCYDYEHYMEEDCGFALDYMNVTPGPKTFTWKETMDEVDKYLEDPSKDREWRKEVSQYFFDEAVNGPDNGERITEEIKRRLKIS